MNFASSSRFGLRRVLALGPVTLALAMLPATGHAAPLSNQARQGLALAKKGDCVSAVPVLEEAELARHSPLTAVALAECYVVLGELIQAADLLRAVAEEEPSRSFGPQERATIKKAGARAEEVEARIPTLELDLARDYEDLVVMVGDQTIVDPSSPIRLPPDTAMTLAAMAPGYRTHEEDVLLSEGEKRVVRIALVAEAPAGAGAKVETDDGKDERPERSEVWIGGRFRGFLIPQFLMDAVGDGGTTVYAPGGALAVTMDVKPGVDLSLSLGYSSYRMGEVAFKDDGAPNTEWEIIDSDLQALMAALDLMVDVPLDDDGNFSFRIGGAVGIGWTFAGDIHRTQAYPVGDPDDPASYRKCDGPNDPPGTFRYCNQLDKDEDHYDGFAEPSWFDDGSRPLVYPYLALPQGGLSWYPVDSFAVDLELGLTTSGLLTGLGMRVGL